AGSGIEIRDQLALEARDLILQYELALLQPLQLQLVDVDVHRQPLDHLVEIAVLDAQLPQFFDVAEQFAIDVIFDFDHRLAAMHSETRVMPSASLAKRPGGFHRAAGSWKSEPTEPASPWLRASAAMRS